MQSKYIVLGPEDQAWSKLLMFREAGSTLVISESIESKSLMSLIYLFECRVKLWVMVLLEHTRLGLNWYHCSRPSVVGKRGLEMMNIDSI
jgi:hypothetical protein